MNIERGQTWSSGNRTEFHVDDIRIIEGETWVYYTNTFTQQTHSCLAPAFEQRFTIVLNKG